MSNHSPDPKLQFLIYTTWLKCGICRYQPNLIILDAKSFQQKLPVDRADHDLPGFRFQRFIDDQKIPIPYSNIRHGLPLYPYEERSGRMPDDFCIEINGRLDVVLCGAWEARGDMGCLQWDIETSKGLCERKERMRGIGCAREIH